ncbi:MAG: GNAT family N-acetyltransferase [Candidatus Eisenbacteria bacterium]
MRIRKAKLDDLDQIAGLCADLQTYHDKFDPTFLMVKDAEKMLKKFLKPRIRSRKDFIVVAEEGDRLVGYVHMVIVLRPPIFKNRPYGFVMDAVVSKGYRGRGIGTKLMAKSYAWLRKKGIRRVELFVHGLNKPGRRFWEREGFETTILRQARRV